MTAPAEPPGAATAAFPHNDDRRLINRILSQDSAKLHDMMVDLQQIIDGFNDPEVREWAENAKSLLDMADVMIRQMIKRNNSRLPTR